MLTLVWRIALMEFDSKFSRKDHVLFRDVFLQQLMMALIRPLVLSLPGHST